MEVDLMCRVQMFGMERPVSPTGGSISNSDVIPQPSSMESAEPLIRLRSEDRWPMNQHNVLIRSLRVSEENGN